MTTEIDRGTVVSTKLIRQASRRQVITELTAAGYSPNATRYGVTLHRLVYRTIDMRGRATTASGLVVLPHRSARHALTTVSYGHGTQVFRGNAPSVTKETWETAPPITYASAGFAAVAPDYLGLGLSPGQHPWMHVPSEVTASIDMLRAARAFATTSGRILGPDVVTTGFSQGASVAMGTARALQEGQIPEFRLSAVAPVSGAYDFRRSQIPAMLERRVNEQWSVAYAALFLVSWNRQHGLYDSPSEVFKAPYDRILPKLLDGKHTGEELVAALPRSLNRLLTGHAVQMLRHPSGPLAAALQVADSTCTDWTPQVPVRLYATTTDEQAAFANSLACQTALANNGFRAPISKVGRTDHAGSNVRATARIVRWLSTR
jgi:pimeloyl-ACP methyl ester carboxylesterase